MISILVVIHMPDEGYALGEGMDAFRNALLPTLHYRTAAMLQKYQMTQEAERAKMDQERFGLQQEEARLNIAQSNLALTEANKAAQEAQEIRKIQDQLAVAYEPADTSGKRQGINVTAEVDRKKQQIPILEKQLQIKTGNIPDRLGEEYKRTQINEMNANIKRLNSGSKADQQSSEEWFFNKRFDPKTPEEQRNFIDRLLIERKGGDQDEMIALFKALEGPYSDFKLYQQMPGNKDAKFTDYIKDIVAAAKEVFGAKGEPGGEQEPKFDTQKDVKDWVAKHPEDKRMLDSPKFKAMPTGE